MVCEKETRWEKDDKSKTRNATAYMGLLAEMAACCWRPCHFPAMRAQEVRGAGRPATHPPPSSFAVMATAHKQMAGIISQSPSLS